MFCPPNGIISGNGNPMIHETHLKITNVNHLLKSTQGTVKCIEYLNAKDGRHFPSGNDALRVPANIEWISIQETRKY